MAHILVICTANICRSPVATALLKNRLEERGLTDWTVSSAGTWAIVPRGASRHSIEVMQRNGFDITGHRARMVDEVMVADADLVLCMEEGHAEALRIEFPAQVNKVFLLSEMIGQTFSVTDPYGGPYQEYELMYDGMEDLIDSGLDRIIDLASTNVAAHQG
ncbi:MAG: low molecular weight protein arginine phosphatase [Chloroflexota bacterium]